MDYVAEMDNVTCDFGHIRALDGLSLKVPAKAVVGIVGPNGAGKTTFIDVLCGLLRPTSGEVKVMGENVFTAGASLRNRIGVLSQETALYDEVSALQNLRFAAALYGVPRPEERIAETLKLVGLSHRAKDIVKGFSGGMQRRLAIARALLHKPPFLILDEPTVGVDVEARHQIWMHIRSLKAAGHSVILTTNYLDEAEALCDRIVILREGKVVSEDTPSGLLGKTGRCLELESDTEGAKKIAQALAKRAGVLRVETVEFGLLVYLAASVNPEDVVHDARQAALVDGFRTRSPDLTEVFRSLISRSGRS